MSKKFIYCTEADVRRLLQQPDLPTEFCIRVDKEALWHALQQGRSNIPEANGCLRLCALLHLGQVDPYRQESRRGPLQDTPAHWQALCFTSVCHSGLSINTQTLPF